EGTLQIAACPTHNPISLTVTYSSCRPFPDLHLCRCRHPCRCHRSFLYRRGHRRPCLRRSRLFHGRRLCRSLYRCLFHHGRCHRLLLALRPCLPLFHRHYRRGRNPCRCPFRHGHLLRGRPFRRLCCPRYGSLFHCLFLRDPPRHLYRCLCHCDRCLRPCRAFR